MDSMMLSPNEFELEVQRILNEEGMGLKDFSTAHLEKMQGTDGDYIIDITARFEALGADFLVLIECKRQSAPVEREIVQVLADKMRSINAQKGMLFSTAGFRSGAIRYAQDNHIALVYIADGRSVLVTKGLPQTMYYPPWIPNTVGYLITFVDDGRENHSTLGVIGPPEWEPKSEGYLRKYLLFK